MNTVCDGCGKPLNRSGVQGDKHRAMFSTDIGMCWTCVGSGHWSAWVEPGTEPKSGAIVPFTKSYARFLARQGK